LLLVSIAAALMSCSTPQPRPSVLVPPSVFNQPPPPEAKALWQQAEKQRASGRTGDAVVTLEGVAQNYPKNAIAAQALAQLGRIYLDQKQPNKALKYIEYLLHTYPQWDGFEGAQLDWLRAQWARGEKKLVLTQGRDLQQSFYRSSDRVNLSLFMADCDRQTGDIENGLGWLAYGFTNAQSQEERNSLNNAALSLLQNTNRAAAQQLLQKKPSDITRVFLEFRLAQLDVQGGQEDEARQRLLNLLTQHPNHPLVPEIQALLKRIASGKRQPLGSGPAPAKTQDIPLDPYRIGCLLPLNGEYAAYGNQVLRGLSLMVQEYNEQHPQRNISLVVKDMKNDPALAVKGFQELTRDQGVLAIVGPLSATAVQALLTPANQMGVPILALTQQTDETPSTPYVLHIFLNERRMVRKLIQYCRTNLKLSHFATLYPNDRYGQKLAKLFAEEVKGSGGSLLASVTYNPEATDFNEPIQKLIKLATQSASAGQSASKAAPFDALFIPDKARTVALIAPQLPYYNVVGVRLLGTNLWSNPELLEAGGIYVEQALFPEAFFAESQVPKVQRFKEQFQETYKVAPTYLEAQAYDALSLLLLALDQTPVPILRGSVWDRLFQIKNYRGLTGTYSFAPDGSLERNYMILEIDNGAVSQVAQ